MAVDAAIAALLSLDPDKSKVRSAGGGGMSSATTLRITTEDVDGSKDFFVKTGSGSEAEHMFAGEHASLNAIANAVPGLAPRSFGHGRLTDQPNQSFLVTEFIDLTSRRTVDHSSATSLAHKLARLHTTPAPIPPSFDRPQFGFSVPTCCGDTLQPNDYKSSWADFFAENRLIFIARQGIEKHGRDKELEDVTQRVCESVVPRLLGDRHINRGKGITPVVVHGDLWSGNASSGKLPGMSDAEELVYDPSACFAHSEYDLGIMRMFGGFGAGFFSAYHKLCPKSEPVDEYDDRLALYEAYHQLNHYALFGGSYRSGGLNILRKLLQKYG